MVVCVVVAPGMMILPVPMIPVMMTMPMFSRGNRLRLRRVPAQGALQPAAQEGDGKSQEDRAELPPRGTHCDSAKCLRPRDDEGQGQSDDERQQYQRCPAALGKRRPELSPVHRPEPPGDPEDDRGADQREPEQEHDKLEQGPEERDELIPELHRRRSPA